MHGTITGDADVAHRPPGRVRRVGQAIRARAKLLLIVVLPTLIAAFYLFAIAADQYESEAHFVVRAPNETPANVGGIGQIISSAAGFAPSQSEAMSVSDYLSSHDAVEELRRESALVERFRRPEADVVSRLWSADPAIETLVRYYRRHVDIDLDTETGITTLRVRTFRPEDSYALTTKLLAIGEERVNALNTRAFEATVAQAERQLEEAENLVTREQLRLTNFRQNRRNIDPPASGEAQIQLVSNLNGKLAEARAQLAGMAGVIHPSSPQYRALASQISALQAQVNAQSSKLAGTGGGATMASDLGTYEELRLRQEFAATRYAAAASALEKAREQAQKQQLFIVRVVEPNMPERALYPKRWTILLTIFFGLLLAYGIGWLIMAGVREHAAS